MKKLIALLMAILMATAMLSTAMADTTTGTNTATSVYTDLSVANGNLANDLLEAITHTLKLSSDELEKLPYDITYEFAVGDPQVVEPLELVGTTDEIKAQIRKFVEGKPTITESITYTTEMDFNNSTKSQSSDLELTWGNVAFKEPGVYRWQITKTVRTDAPDASNEDNIAYLYVKVIDNSTATESKLALAGVTVSLSSTLTNIKSDNESMDDQYPASMVNLQISKTVTGDQGSRNQYFEFKVKLESPAGAEPMTYDISGVSNPVPATAYHSQMINPETVTVYPIGDTKNEPISLWLKHGQIATIENMLFGTTYTIIENPGDYTIDAVVVDNDSGSDHTISEDKKTVNGVLESDESVAYTNKKNATVPTGIDLQTSAPIFGLLMAVAMMFMVFAGKRKEQMN